MWDGKRYRCSGCGEVYCESLKACPCCNATCVALDADCTDPEVSEPSIKSSSSSFDVLDGLTEDQRTVVEIDNGRHLVLAPPGTGKTEMLTRRVVRALASGRNVRRMFCGTFTIRAAVEMRDRISSVTKRPKELLPEIGNLHHFCYAFLSRNHFIPKERQIVDEVFVRDVIEDCIAEFKDQYGVRVLTSDGGTILRMPGEIGVSCEGLPRDVVDACSGYLDLCDESCQDRKPVVVKIVTGMEGMRQRLAGIPERLCEPELTDEKRKAFIANILNRYVLTKERLSVIDFDDLLIETYARLAGGALSDDEKYDWIQVDEVQDLNPLQWEIVDMVAAANAVLVYFGDYDQSIFSFMGASLSVLDEKARLSVIHSFKKNFRATSYLLDMLTRYSFKVLESRFPFVPSPNVYENANGALAVSTYEVELAYKLSRSGEKFVDYRETRALMRKMMLNTAVGHVYEFLRDGSPGRVAVLVQTNKDADAIAESLAKQNIAGVVRFSGEEFSRSAAYRNAAALFESVSNPISRPAWSRLFYLFGGKSVQTQRRARELAMSIFEAGMHPNALFQDDYTRLAEKHVAWMKDHEKFVTAFRNNFQQYRREFLIRIGGRSSIRSEIVGFRDYIDSVNKAQEPTPLGMLDHFFAWTDEQYANDKRSFAELLANDWLDLSRMKEADMLTGTDRIVVSTVHKAKGLQFDTVIIPDADGYPSYYASKSQLGKEESARLLYVALSRAKRQLILMRGVAVDCRGCPSREFSGKSEFIDQILESFSSMFADFYYKKDYLNLPLDEIAKTDWLALQYKVAEAVRNRRTIEDVEKLIRHPQPSIRRMAVLSLEWEEDSVRRTALLKSVLSGSDFKAMLNAVYVIGKVNCSDALKELRGLMTRLGANQRALKLEILTAYDAMQDSPKIRELIGDSIYDVDGGLRREASRMLKDRGDPKWEGVIRGDRGDWERMMGVSDVVHDQFLTWMIGRRCPFVCDEVGDLMNRRQLMASGGERA